MWHGRSKGSNIIMVLSLCAMPLTNAVADTVTLWPIPKSASAQGADIPQGAYSYVIEKDSTKLTSVSVMNGGWTRLSGAYTFSNTISGWVIEGGEDVLKTVRITEIAPDSLDSSGSPFQKLTSVIVSEGITALGGVGAFNGASGLKSITLPSTLKTIGASSFRNCSSLEAIDIPDAVETIGTGAFLGCGNLQSVMFPASLRSIGDQAFHGSGVVSVDLSDGCTTIGQNAFSGCANLLNVGFGGCETIGDSAFNNCTRLSSVSLPPSVATIGDSAFVGCESLSHVCFAEGLRSIGSSAFSRCALIEELILPDGLETIGGRAFNCCSGIARLVIPSSVSSVGSSAFYNCAPKDLTESVLWTMSYSSVTNFTLLPGLATFGTKFRNSAAIEQVTLPETVTKIEAEAFGGCTNLVYVSIPDTVEIVGNKAFYNCSCLSSLPLLGGSVTNWGSSVFRYCTGIEKLTVPGNMKSIPDYMFANCSNLADVVVSEGVETISKTAFLYDDAMRKLSLPSTATNLSYGNYSSTDYAKNLEVATFHQLHPPKNVAKAFLRNFTGYAYYPPDFADEWEGALSADVMSTLAKPWTEALEDEPGAADLNGVAVPYGWLAKYGLTLTNTPEEAARMKTGKVDPDGGMMRVWHDYVSGTDPTDVNSRFSATISMLNGVPNITWTPNLNTNGTMRRYTVLGKTNLTDSAEWAPTNSVHRFFKVIVNMP